MNEYIKGIDMMMEGKSIYLSNAGVINHVGYLSISAESV